MNKYLLIESRDPFEVKEVENDYRIASELARADNEVTLYLVQNGVFAARRDARDSGLQTVIASGVTVLSDDFSLRERGIAREELLDGVRVAPLDIVVDQLAQGHKTLWL